MHKLLFLSAGLVFVAAMVLFVVRLRVLSRTMTRCAAVVPDAGPYRDCAANAEQATARAPAAPKLWILVGRVFPDPCDPAWRGNGSNNFFNGDIRVYLPLGQVDVAGRTVADGRVAKRYIAAVVACQRSRCSRQEDTKFEAAMAKLPLAPKEP